MGYANRHISEFRSAIFVYALVDTTQFDFLNIDFSTLLISLKRRARRWEDNMKRSHPFEIILIGKSSLLKEGLAGILRSANFRVRAPTLSAYDSLINKVQGQKPLFLIIHAGEGFDTAIEQIALLRDRHPDGRIAIVADRYRPNGLVLAFRSGATGYFGGDMTCDAFIKSIELIMMGETVLPPTFLSYALDPKPERPDDAPRRDLNKQTIVVPGDTPQLSPRETSILRCLIEGDSNKKIARRIDIAEATVKVHIKAILRKVGVQNRTQAAIWGMNNAVNGVKQPLPAPHRQHECVE
jgi:two-component system nitrate/nitrite response regulator NarL